MTHRTESQVSYHIPAATSPSCPYVISNDALSLLATATVRRAKERKYQTLVGSPARSPLFSRGYLRAQRILATKPQNPTACFKEGH